MLQRLSSSTAQHEGWSFAEVAVTTAIIGVLATISAPNLSRFWQRSHLENALLRLQGALRETQNEAIRRSRGCTVTISPGIDQSVVGDCLVTGDRPLKGIQVLHNHAGGTGPWTVAFDRRGRNRNDKGTAVLTMPEDPSFAPKCLVLSIGIGLHRIGEYRGDVAVKPRAEDCITTQPR